MQDEKLYGSVHITLGMNNHLGGQNHSILHLDRVRLRLCLWLDVTLLPLEG
jgi:hypothetical protein